MDVQKPSHETMPTDQTDSLSPAPIVGQRNNPGALEIAANRFTLSGAFMAVFLLLALAFLFIKLFTAEYSSKDNTSRILEQIQSSEKKQAEYLEKQKNLLFIPPSISGKQFRVSGGKCFRKVNDVVLSSNLTVTTRDIKGAFIFATHSPANSLPMALLIWCIDDLQGVIVSSANLEVKDNGIVTLIHNELSKR